MHPARGGAPTGASSAAPGRLTRAWPAVDVTTRAPSPRSSLQGPHLSGIVRQSWGLSIIGALVRARVRVVFVPQHDGRRSAMASGRTVEEETMRFGLFGSAQAKRGGPDVDSGAGYR